jgi:hypothetical protein
MEVKLASRKNTRAETFIERNAWKGLLLVILFIGFFGISDMVGGASDLQAGETVFMHSITGMSWNELQAASPGVANLIDVKFRVDGAALTSLAILSLAICLTGFKRGERWAWISLWAIPFWMIMTATFIAIVDKLPDSGTPVPVISGFILSVIWIAMLGLSYRRFFQS